MGTDIFGWVETKVNDKWVAVEQIKDRSRNYKRFTALASICGEGLKPKGVPKDVSDTVKYHIDAWSYPRSYMSLKEAAEIWLNTVPHTQKISAHEKKHPIKTFICSGGEATFEDWINNSRVVFWFDN